MNELKLKYGCNSNQKPSRISMRGDKDLPTQVLYGRFGYVSFTDTFNGWRLVRKLKVATGLSAAASFKHVSPIGAVVGPPLDEILAKIYWADDMGELSPLACAYARVRGADRVSSFGDFIILPDVHDVDTTRIIKREVSDGVIMPGYEPEMLETLKAKENDNYNVIQIDGTYVSEEVERKQMFGIVSEQGGNELRIDKELLSNMVTVNKDIPESAIRDLCISLTILKYTQSNSMCYVKDGQMVGIGAGQQFRVHCTRLTGGKANNWYLRQIPQVLGLQFVDGIRRADRDDTINVYTGGDYMDMLANGIWGSTFKVKPPVFAEEGKWAWLDRITDVALGPDAFFPFGDNIDRAFKGGMKYVAQPNGSVRDDNVIAACDKYGIVMAFTGIRLFHRQAAHGISVVPFRLAAMKKM